MESPESEPTAADPIHLADRWADRFISGPFTASLFSVVVILFVTWLPGYLTWPWWPDIDTFASMAQSWTLGELPYRDFIGHNFPGQIYLFMVLGPMFGWGKTWPIYAFDAALLASLGLLMFVWSTKRFGRELPGLLGYISFLCLYMRLNQYEVVQRDFHGPAFAVASLLILQTWPGRAGRWVSAISYAIGFIFRPHVIFLLPGILLGFIEAEPSLESGPPNRKRSILRGLEWGMIAGLTLLILLIPLIKNGLIPDLLQGLKRVSSEGGYGEMSPSFFVLFTVVQVIVTPRPLIYFLILFLIPFPRGSKERSIAQQWNLTLLSTFFYRSIHPAQHVYLAIPLALVAAVNLAVVVQRVLEIKSLTPTLRLGWLILLIPLSYLGIPDHCLYNEIPQAIRDLREGNIPEKHPTGYVRLTEKLPSYSWESYRDLILYLKSHSHPNDRLASALVGPIGVCGPSGLAPVFRNESGMYCLNLFDPPKAEVFVERLLNDLKRDENAIAVLVPAELAEPAALRFRKVGDTIREQFKFEARVGPFEIWRKTAKK